MYGRVACRLLFAVLATTIAAVKGSAHQPHQYRSARPHGWPARPQGWPTRVKDETFDYVVIGGGTAGLTMAVRLAENSFFSVAVIEAGGFYEQDNGNISVVPGYCTVHSGTDPADVNPLVDWGFVTEPLKVWIPLSDFLA